MSVRREAREAAIQFLYQYEQGGSNSQQETIPNLDAAIPTKAELEQFYAFRRLSPAARSFSSAEIQGTLEHLEEIDFLLAKQTQNYQLERISAVDRNILRLALYEILYVEEIPKKVTINEAINIAKKYGTEKSGRFINGILDHIALSSSQ